MTRKLRIITDPDELWLREREVRVRGYLRQNVAQRTGVFNHGIPVQYKGKEYRSIRAAARATGDDWFTVKAGAKEVRQNE